MDNRPIGVFDSGIGGLTVVKGIIEHLPHENIIYFGDIARLPYGTKSVAVIQKFASQTVKFLLKQNVKLIIIACNTISAIAREVIVKVAGRIPVIDVISSTIKYIDKMNSVAIIATPATINSKAYCNAIKLKFPKSQVFSQACPLFVPLIEEGYINHPALDMIAQDYLKPLINKQINHLILGCTHYPLIKNTIQKIVDKNVLIIDPSISIINDLLNILNKNKIQQKADYHFYVTDIPLKFREIGENFLGRKIDRLELVNIDE